MREENLISGFSFKENEEFEYSRTVLGLYEGSAPTDTSALSIELGTYTADENTIDIELTKRFWWDSFYENMEDLEESGVNANRYMEVSYEIIDGALHIVYFTLTDVVTEEQETPGWEKYEEVYGRE